MNMYEKLNFIKEHKIYLILLFILAFSPHILQNLKCAPIEHDEGTYFTVTSRMLAGDIVYKDVYDNKLPVLYYSIAPIIATCGHEIVCIRTFAFGVNLVIALIIFLISLRTLSGTTKYLPAIFYLILSDVLGLNIFLRCEFFINLFWVITLYYLVNILNEERLKLNGILFGFFVTFSFFTKPAAVLAFALPFLYVLLRNKNQSSLSAHSNTASQIAGAANSGMLDRNLSNPLRNTKAWISDPQFMDKVQLIFDAIKGASVCIIIVFLISFKVTDLGNFMAQANGWGLGDRINYFFTADFVTSTLKCVFFLTTLALPLVFLLRKKDRNDFENLLLLFFFSISTLMIFNGFSFVFTMFDLILILIPVSFFLGISAIPLIDKLNTAYTTKINLFEIFVCSALIFVPLFITSSFFQSVDSHMLRTSHISFCGERGQIYDYLAAHTANKSFFVFPDRAGYYFILDKKPFMPLLYFDPDHPVDINEWYKNILKPVMDNPPQTVLIVNSYITTYNKTKAYASLMQMLNSSYNHTYFNLSDGNAMFFYKN